MESAPDVVVVGAGASGLACAAGLERRGASVVVLEARDRIGGRVWTLREPGEPLVELGAMLVHGQRACTWDVIREAGLTAARGVGGPAGRAVVLMHGEVRDAADLYRESGVPGFGSVERIIAERMGPDHPLTNELKDTGWSDLGRALAANWFEQIWCADPELLSAEGVARVEDAWDSGHENFVIQDGYDQVTEHLARGLDVRCGSRVHRIRWSPHGVEVHTVRRERIRASACVLTVPPTVCDGIRIAPPLPAEKVAAARAIPVGAVMRVVARLRQPSPETLRVTELGPLAGFWRTQAGSDRAIAWIGGPAASRAASVPPHELVLRMRPAIPWLERRWLDSVLIADWGSDPFSRGGYSYPRVGALDAPAVWAEPVGRTLFFAGEATCGDRHPATVHGAIESGRRAAGEVADALGR